jgi:hypothetical protein
VVIFISSEALQNPLLILINDPIIFFQTNFLKTLNIPGIGWIEISGGLSLGSLKVFVGPNKPEPEISSHFLQKKPKNTSKISKIPQNSPEGNFSQFS